jgi:nucleoside-diphosphate-sugar epimerase
MKALVTGADGFAGRWLCRLLVGQGWDVDGWVRCPPVAPIAGVLYRTVDIRDASACEQAMRSPDEVYHLAAMTHVGAAAASPDDAWKTNVEGTRNVLGKAPSGCRPMLVSTCHVYGRPQFLPLTESHPLAPVGTYARTKAEAERAARECRPDVVIARAFHHTGPGQPARFALSEWAEALSSEVATIRTGDLELRRDYSDVRDIVAGYVHLLRTAPPGAIVNLCSGRAPTLREMLALLNGGRSPRTETDPNRLRPGDVQELRGDPSVALALGWRPRIGLAETLRDLRQTTKM